MIHAAKASPMPSGLPVNVVQRFNNRFRQEVEELTGQLEHHIKRGPKTTKSDHSPCWFLL
jgi:hypothetical protein